MKQQSITILILVCMGVFFSCKEDLCAGSSCSDDLICQEGICILPEIAATFANQGTSIVINEGAFNNGNGSLSFIDADNIVTNNIFFGVNATPIGDVVQSYNAKNDIGIIVVNNSQKVELVNANTFKSIKTVTSNLSYPRFSLPINDSIVYITNGNIEGTVVVLNLSDYTTSTIAVGEGPEELLQINELVYVTNSGGWEIDSTISVINTNSHAEIQKIVVGHRPVDLEEDVNGMIWVLCDGESDESNWPNVTKLQPAKLVKINPVNNTVASEVEIIPVNGSGNLSRLTINKAKTKLFYLKNGDVYLQDIDSLNMNNQSFIDGGSSGFYGLDIHPDTDEIYATTNGFTGNQQVKIFSATGNLISTLDVGIGANGVYFNR